MTSTPCKCDWAADPAHDRMAALEEDGLAGVYRLLVAVGTWGRDVGVDDQSIAPFDWGDFVAQHQWRDQALVVRTVALLEEAWERAQHARRLVDGARAATAEVRRIRGELESLRLGLEAAVVARR